MGTDCVNKRDFDRRYKSDLELIKSEFPNLQLIDYHISKEENGYGTMSDVVYCVWKKEDKIFAMVHVITISNDMVCWTSMTEGMGPFYYNCPKSIIDKLTDTDSEYAKKWRKNCIKQEVVK